MLSSHVRGCFELCMCKMCTIILLTTFVWPLIWGWKLVDLVILVSNKYQRLNHNVLWNLLSIYEIMDRGIPKCTHTCSKRSLAMTFVAILLLQASKMAILENRPMSKNTKRLPCLVEGKYNI